MYRFIGFSILFFALSSGLSESAAHAQAQPVAAPSAATTFRGCLQGDTTKGFALLSTTTNPDGSAGQTKTYRVIIDSKTDARDLTNKIVEIAGNLSTKPEDVHSIASTDALGGRKIVDSARTTPSSLNEGTQMWAEGTLTARSVRQVENSCAASAVKKE
ncbi:MAG TPA: hypothetical protein VGC23_03280 [Vicinamibacterales bacterium]